MANIKSQIKRIKTNKKSNLRNKSFKSLIKTNIKKTKNLFLLNNNNNNKDNNLTNTISLIDKSVNKGIYHKNKSSRLKSKLMNKFNKIKK